MKDEKKVLQELWELVWNVPFNAPMVNARKMNNVYRIVAENIGEKPFIRKTFKQIENEGNRKKQKKGVEKYGG